MKEERKNPRYKAAYFLEMETGKKNIALELIDLSKCGISFLSPQKLRKGTNLRVRIFFKTKKVSLDAKVITAETSDKNKTLIGAELLSVPEEFKTILDKEIDEIQKLQIKLNVRRQDPVSFKQASAEYLNNE
ncbi:MAG: PilZ domain-containing protein [Candidatus Omnitrophota bacterium]